MEPRVLIQIDENPNCAPMDGLVFQPRTTPRAVSQVRVARDGIEMWCDITGFSEPGAPCPAMACLIDDSGDGKCHLVFGGPWGLRLKTGDGGWDLNDPDQWSETYLVLPGDGEDVRFQTAALDNEPRV